MLFDGQFCSYLEWNEGGGEIMCGKEFCGGVRRAFIDVCENISL